MLRNDLFFNIKYYMSSYNFLEGTIPQKIVIAQDFKIKPNDATSDLSASFIAGEEYTASSFVAKINSDLGLASGALAVGEDSYLSHERTRELFASLGAHNDFTGTNVFHSNVDISGAAHNLIIEGKVGIGMTPGSDMSGNVTLDISGTDAVRIPVGTSLQRPSADSTSHYGYIRYNTDLSSYEGFGAGNAWGSLGGVKDVDQDTYISAETAAGEDNDELKFYTDGEQRMVIDASGNVGIGKTTVSENVVLDVSGNIVASGNVSGVDVTASGNATFDKKVHVKGNLQVDGSLNFLGELIQTDTKIQVSEIFDISANGGDAPALSVRQNGFSQDIAHFYKGSSSAMVIDGNGNVGIGTTSPAYTLDVSGHGRIDDLFIGSFNTAPQSVTYVKPQNSNTLVLGAAGNNVANFWSDGRVGIGVWNPSQNLDVIGGINSKGDGTGNVRLGGANDVYHVWCDAGTTALRFGVNGGEKMRIDASGNVGIGTSNP